MASPSSAATWNNFFLSAGIPVAVAQKYAVTFSNHRMSIDMLREITKDILIDMGIKAMGDIIAILRHAKNLCAQDELKIGTTSSKPTNDLTTSQTNVNAVNDPINSSLARRMPISTSRSMAASGSVATNPTLGNKIQSRISLKSGALMASTNAAMEKFINSSNGNINTNGKRPASNISASLAKRLKPQVDSSHRNGSGQHTEKTLTVRYPSSQAIARAQQRISSNLSPFTTVEQEPTMTTKTTAPSNIPIKARLGFTKVKLEPTVNNNNSFYSNNNNSSGQKLTHNQRSYNQNATDRHSGGQNINRGHHNNGNNRGSPIRSSSLNANKQLKSTVFHRLGNNPRR